MYVWKKEMYKIMIKKIILLILSILISMVVMGQTLMYRSNSEDTITQSIYYQRTLINTKRWNVYGYSSYDLNSYDESGIGICYTIPYKRSKRNKLYKEYANNKEYK
jgi:uncharacterized protein YxeA